MRFLREYTNKEKGKKNEREKRDPEEESRRSNIIKSSRIEKREG